MDDFDMIYSTIVGQMRRTGGVPWVKNIFVEGTAYNKAYQDFWTAREHLCARFGIEWEDPDLELFMDGILDLEEDLARAMFEATIEYAKRDYRL